MSFTTTVQVPATATLFVHVNDGDGTVREATAEDLQAFGLAQRSRVYADLATALRESLSGDVDGDQLLPDGALVDTNLNPVRYLMERIVMGYQDEPGHLYDQNQMDLRAIERALRGLVESNALSAGDRYRAHLSNR